MFCLNVDCRQFGFLARTASELVGQDVLILAPRQDEGRIRAGYGALFEGIEALPPVAFALPGRARVEVGAYVGRGLRAMPR